LQVSELRPAPDLNACDILPSRISPGAGLGAYFIGAWVDEEMPWAHIDITGAAWREDEGIPTSPAGATGFGVRLLDRFVREYHE
jgi:leucyl aminopeptidase